MSLLSIFSKVTGPEERFSIEDRILNAILFTSAFVGIITVTVNFIVGISPLTNIITGSLVILIGILYLIGRKKPNHTRLLYPFFILQVLVILTVWYYFDGVSGVSNIYIITFLYIIVIIAKGKHKLITIGLFFLIATSAMLLEYYNPEIVHNYEDEKYEILNTYFSTVFVSAGILLMTYIIMESYQKIRTQLEESNRTKNKFFSIISHDLKAPLSGLAALGEYMHDNKNNIDEDTRLRMEEAIYTSTKSTYVLLENLLQWARSESGILIPVPSRILINELTRDIVKLYEENISAKQLAISYQIDQDMAVMADVNMVNLVLRNLISNAIKFTPGGGTIELSAKQSDDLKTIAINIRDEGVGIDEKYIDKIFDLESKYRRLGTNSEPGTGLGLKLCKEFVQKNGGSISVTSELGKGSTFRILLPAAI